jgi:hypothetical protein
MSKKAMQLDEIDQAVRFNEPIGAEHHFFTDFSNFRGEFEERLVYKNLNVKRKGNTFSFDASTNSANKSILFLGGMRGSGKTSELAKYATNLHSSACFFCVTCNLDEELDMNELEYMDILILQLQKLTEQLNDTDLSIDDGIINKMEKWFDEREKEVKKELKTEVGLEVGVESEIGGFFQKILKVFGKFHVGVTGSQERAVSVRRTLKNRFSEFASMFNEYIEEVNIALRKEGIAQEILFIVDGLEKTLSAETRYKVIVNEQNRLQKIKTYTIFTLPIELMKERQHLNQFSNVEAFPFVKLLERKGERNQAAFERFTEFVYKRIDASLFENENIVTEAIYYSGGSPRELLRILELAAFYADEDKGKIDKTALEKALQRLADQTAQYLTEPMFAKLKEIRNNNKAGLDTPFDNDIQEMLEKILVMEYNSGSYKRVNPILELSNLYKQRVES